MSCKRQLNGTIKYVHTWCNILDDLLIAIINTLTSIYSIELLCVNKHWSSVLQGKKYWNQIDLVQLGCISTQPLLPFYVQYAQGRELLCADESHVNCCERLLQNTGESPLKNMCIDRVVLWAHWKLLLPHFTGLHTLELKKMAPTSTKSIEFPDITTSFEFPQLKYFLCSFRIHWAIPWFLWMLQGMPVLEGLSVGFGLASDKRRIAEENAITQIAKKSTLQYLCLGFVNQTLSAEQVQLFSQLPIKHWNSISAHDNSVDINHRI